MNVWATRDETSDGPLCVALRGAGLGVVHEPVIRRSVVDGWDVDAVSSLDQTDWLVLTSVFAIEVVAAATQSRTPCVAVVGDRSREAASGAGFRVELVASDGGAAGLFAELRERVSSGSVCYPRSSLAKVPPPWGDVKVRSPLLYETTSRVFDRSVVDRIDVVAVTSPSAVRAIGRIDRPFASIGPTTTAALTELGIRPCVEASIPTFDALASAISGHSAE